MKIKLTVKDIFYGHKFSPSSCPIALALKRETKAIRVSVTSDSVDLYFKDGTYLKRLPLPEKAGKFVLEFDSNMNPEPIEFEMDYEGPENYTISKEAIENGWLH